MIIPSIAQVQNLAASVIGYGYWSLVDTLSQKTIASFDSFFDFDYNKENAIASYPLEDGKFASYNKQQNPFNITITLIKSGLTLPYDKKNFVSALEKYCDKPLLVDVITPHGAYLHCSLSGLSFKNSPDENNDIIAARINIKQIEYIASEKTGTVKIPNASARARQGLKSILNIPTPEQSFI